MEESRCTRWWVCASDVFAWMCDDKNSPYVLSAFFVLSALLLYVVMLSCQACVVGILIFSLFFCCAFRPMLAITCACLAVLWFHGWRFGGGLALSWS